MKTTKAPPLHGFIVSLLLAGPSAKVPGWRGTFDSLPEPVRRQARQVMANARVGAALWQENKEYLFAEAARLGIRPRWPGRKFFAQSLLPTTKVRR